LYPQEFIIELDRVYDISEVRVTACNIKTMVIESCDQDEANAFIPVSSQEVKFGAEANGEMIDKTIQIPFRARHVKFHIKQGWSDFCAVYRVGLIA